MHLVASSYLSFTSLTCHQQQWSHLPLAENKTQPDFLTQRDFCYLLSDELTITTMAFQSRLKFFSSPQVKTPIPDDKAPDTARSTPGTKTSCDDESPIASLDAPSTPPPSQRSAALSLPATLAMESSFELPDSTDWLATSLPAFEPLEAALRCEVCKEFYNKPVITSCAHTFCSLCIRRCIAIDGKCPACKSACQADKLQPNIAVREIATKFQEARPKALELACAKDNDDGETAAPASGRKRKREVADGDEEGRRTTRSRQTRRSTRPGDEIITHDMPVVTPDSDEENEDEYIPDGMVPCPICKKPMKEEAVFNHIPICPAAQKDTGTRKTRSRKDYAFPNPLQARRKDNDPPPTRLSGLHYPMLNDKSLRKRLQDLGIPTWGTRQQLVKRHQEWLNIYNSNCDASDEARKPKQELLRELDDWERTQGGRATAKESHIMRKDFDGQNYAMAHKNQFDDLIANVRKRAKETSKPREEKVESTPAGSSGSDPQPAQADKPEFTPDPRHPYENNEAALSSIRQKVEEANRTDSAFPPLSHNTKDANMKAAQDAGIHQDKIPLGFAPENPLGSPTRKVPMFRMPEEPVVDVESSTTIQ
ncbi:hypothetical protein PMIN06_008238 [Paraphaeosphaeria minitans]